MAIIKSVNRQNLELRRENARLRNQVVKQREMLGFLGVLNDVDIEDLMDETEAEEGTDDGEE